MTVVRLEGRVSSYPMIRPARVTSWETEICIFSLGADAERRCYKSPVEGKRGRFKKPKSDWGLAMMLQKLAWNFSKTRP